MQSALDLFHPLVARWFRERVGAPTEIQKQAWPCIAAGENVFVTAPTGSGKTLTAFLYAIDSLIASGEGKAGAENGSDRRAARRSRGTPPRGSQILYISPLKALNNDIERNLNSPLADLRDLFSSEGVAFPRIEVMVRSGDTPQNERRRLLQRPPEILITTPESLNVLLTTQNGRSVLAGVRTLILDEIHNTAGSKRGTYLMTAVERLAHDMGEFQRIALSATVRPLEATARFVAGYRRTTRPAREEAGAEENYEPRPIRILASAAEKSYDVRVASPAGAPELPDADAWWAALVTEFRGIVARNRSTIFFANSRRMAEKLTRLMNEGQPEDIAYAHHGSLSREIRLAVEQRLKSGELPAIVATSSLELGIDIGEVDEVILVQTPGEPSSSIQRIGRSGHGVGQVSRGTFYPLHPRDFLDAAVALRCVLDGSLEEVRIPPAPLDVLSQVLLSMCLDVSQHPDELFAIIRTCSPYHDLERRWFDMVIDMLTGRYADRRIYELKPRLVRDGAGGELRSVAAVRPLLYRSGGVIPDRGYFTLRTADSKAKLGELDEEFVWERSIGDVFPMGNRLWRIVSISHNDVDVAPAHQRAVTVPFWRADELNRGFFFSEKVGEFVERASTRLDEPAFAEELMTGVNLDKTAARVVIQFLKDQRGESGMGLPHRHRITAETYSGARGQKGQQTVINTFWGGKVNRPFSLVLSLLLEKETGGRVGVFHNKDSVLVNSRDEFSLKSVLRGLTPEQVVPLLREKLESTAFFGALFRQNAQRALLIPRRGFKERMPLWLSRVRAKRLFEAVLDAREFPILTETWQECLSQEFELPALVALLGEVADGRIEVEQCRLERPTPLARELVWQETNDLMYASDAPETRLRSELDDDLVRAAADELGGKWVVPEETVTLLRSRLERTALGYAPGDWTDALAHIDERTWIPRLEWMRLIASIVAEHGEQTATDILRELSPRALWLQSGSRQERQLDPIPGGPGWGVVSRSSAVHVGTILSAEGEGVVLTDRFRAFFQQWAIAPVRLDEGLLRESLGITSEQAERILQGAFDSGLLKRARFGPDDQAGWLVPENLERLLRLRRTVSRARRTFLPVDRLPLFLARLHGMAREGEPSADREEAGERLRAALESLFAFPGHAELWETDYLPDRCPGYRSADLDTLLRESDLFWCGSGSRRVRFLLEEDVELLEEKVSILDGAGEASAEGRLARGGRFTLADLLDSGSSSDQVTRELWAGVWAGRVSCDDFGALRRALATGFRPAAATGGRMRLDRWRSSRPFTGYWFLVPRRDSGDALTQMERDRERARVLLQRYGVIFRELLHGESPAFRGTRIFRALRLMELSGEVVAGRFFEGVSGWQFASARAMRMLAEWEESEVVWWQNATDPIACTGPRYGEFQSGLPARLPGNRIVYRGHRPVLQARRNGLHLEFLEEAPAWSMPDLDAFFAHLLAASGRRAAVVVETVNGGPAVGSAHESLLVSVGFRRDLNRLVLRSYRPAE